MDKFFAYDFDLRFAAVWWPLGARPGQDGVRITDEGVFEATFGRFHVQTPVANIATAQNTGPYHPWKAVGLRLSSKDSGLTMGTTGRCGACVTFKEKVPKVLGLHDHRGLTVTVADPDGLVAALGFTPEG